tara:strand:- start:144 stop:650 length:507 start_codon:yes stop_codon:yes gene_type:complete
LGKVNRKGRTKHEPFILLHRGVTNSEAWRSLSCEAKALLIEVWARHNGANNGQIALSHRQARAALRIGNGKVQKTFLELQEKGFLIARLKGSFNWKVAAGEGRASEWELTTEACEGQPAKGWYRNWTEKQNTVPTSGTAGSGTGNQSASAIGPTSTIGSGVGNRYGCK